MLPWLALLPDVRIVASDPASVLLATMISRVALLGDEDRVMGVVAEPDRVPVAPGSVDLVSGVACLHELDDPDLVLAAAAQALVPGGYAIFIAPFDGHGILRLAYERIRAEAALWPAAPLDPGVAEALEGLGADIAARTLPDSSAPSFRAMEAKWLFCREVARDRGAQHGVPRGAFPGPQRPRDALSGPGHDPGPSGHRPPDATLPDWALDLLDSFDRALRPPVKRLLMVEGTIVLRR